jgi:lysophospholipase L1-like esterase
MQGGLDHAREPSKLKSIQDGDRGVKLALIGLGILALGIVLIEVGLQWLGGFGHPPLYQADDHIGYLLAPNQRLRRLGNRIEINQYSMRTGPIAAQRPAQQLRIFVLGDSIVNGNWWTDQAQTLSARLERSLQDSPLATVYPEVRVLNASANSWGPRNELAYLQRFGTFESQIIVLVINTDDLFGTQPTSLQVGRDRNYPDRNPASAIAELLNYARRRPNPIPGLQAIQNEPGDRVGFNLEAIQQIKRQVVTSGGQMILAMTPLKREVLPPGPRDYEIKARQRVQDLVDSEQIPYLDFLASFQQTELPDRLYRDHIHLSPTGTQQVCQAITNAIEQQLIAVSG